MAPTSRATDVLVILASEIHRTIQRSVYDLLCSYPNVNLEIVDIYDSTGEDHQITSPESGNTTGVYSRALWFDVAIILTASRDDRDSLVGVVVRPAESGTKCGFSGYSVGRDGEDLNIRIINKTTYKVLTTYTIATMEGDFWEINDRVVGEIPELGNYRTVTTSDVRQVETVSM